jgi:hypothetical protein
MTDMRFGQVFRICKQTVLDAEKSEEDRSEEEGEEEEDL